MPNDPRDLIKDLVIEEATTENGEEGYDFKSKERIEEY